MVLVPAVLVVPWVGTVTVAVGADTTVAEVATVEVGVEVEATVEVAAAATTAGPVTGTAPAAATTASPLAPNATAAQRAGLRASLAVADSRIVVADLAVVVADTAAVADTAEVADTAVDTAAAGAVVVATTRGLETGTARDVATTASPPAWSATAATLPSPPPEVPREVDTNRPINCAVNLSRRVQ